MMIGDTCLFGVANQLAKSFQLRLELFVVLLQNSHPRFEAALLLTQQSRLARCIDVAVRLRAVDGYRATVDGCRTTGAADARHRLLTFPVRLFAE